MKRTNRVCSLIMPGWFVFCVFAVAQNPDTFTDPNPPEVFEPGEPITEAKDWDGLTFRAAPKPLAQNAVTAEWPRFLGPNDNAKTPETQLLDKFPEGGPKIVWECLKGTGYTSPAIVDGRLVLFDRFGDEEVSLCLDPATGKEFWRSGYPVEYTDRIGYSNGPRASAVIDSGKVYTLGVRSVLTCLDLKSGTKLWQRDLDAEFEIAPYFFGHGACPLIYDGKVIVNLGGRGGLCVAAFDQHSGKLVWGTKHEWLASYASPVVRELQGKPRLLVFAGGEDRRQNPDESPFGGLLCIDPATGELHDAFPWRSTMYTSVNASGPVVAGENRIFISECYTEGGVLLELTPELKWKEVWRAPKFGLHWMTPLVIDGYIYGFLGRNEPDAWLACYDAATGEEKWRDDLIWQDKLPDGRPYNLSYFRGSLLWADEKAYALGELGTLGIFKLKPGGFEELDKANLFFAKATWSLPVLHKGLLYISQHEEEVPIIENPKPKRLICYDLRKAE
ncbi:MAG: PQQ-like beta-propeller repeat protein [Verrucomicrobiales bacterium]|nr:PQQ-like beta-propeller repeat protein [Verrucomicrobiales bacterium]